MSTRPIRLKEQPITDSRYKTMQKFRLPKTTSRLGSLYIRESGGIIQQDFLFQLHGPSGVRIYDEMQKNDPTIGSILFAMRQAMRQISWDAEAVSSSREDQEARDFLKSNMHDMEITFDDFLSDVLSFLTFGWSYFDVVNKVRRGENRNPALNSEFDDGLVGWRNFTFLSQQSLMGWELNKESGKTLGMNQLQNDFTTIKFIPIEKAIHFRSEYAGGNPEGCSILRTLYVPRFRKNALEELEAIGAERDLVGLPTLTPPEGFDWEDPANDALLSWAKELITHVSRGEYQGVIYPEVGWSLELINSGGQRQFNMNEIINRYDKRMAMAVLAQFIMLGMERVGSFALVKSLSDLWYSAVDGFVKSIEQTLNKFEVRRLFRRNVKFASLKNLPKIKATRINVPSLPDLADYINVLVGRGIIDGQDAELREELLRIGKLPTTPADRKVVGGGDRDGGGEGEGSDIKDGMIDEGEDEMIGEGKGNGNESRQ